MKKILAIILCAAVLSPALAFADNNSEHKNERSQKSSQVDGKHEKNEKEKKEKHENKKEERSNQPKKINYFLCKTDTGWNVVPLNGVKDKNSNRALGTACFKIPYGITKKLKNFMGTTTPDIIAPTISSITVGTLTPISAVVSWNTNELATGKLYFGTTTPPILSVSTTTLSLAHSFILTGLTASTTYNLILESADVASNIATSTGPSFTTGI